jgi:hypothetical protein
VSAFGTIDEFDELHDRLVDCEDYLDSESGANHLRELDRLSIKLTALVKAIEESSEKFDTEAPEESDDDEDKDD